MTPDDHINAAADLLRAEETREQIGLLTKRYPEMGMDLSLIHISEPTRPY